ncbi:MAG: twin-arginine translocase subunit TatB [Proteobacteria bacterium]|nr:twin-arginine translocase subunit TatB [Pseudomonadota bacterium]
MFDLSWSHILIFLVVALVVVGPKDMPRLLRIAGQWVGKARGMANEFRKSFDEMARQSELDELRSEIENLRRERPLSELENEMNRPLEPAPVMRPLDTPLDPGPAMDAHNHAVEEAPPEVVERPVAQEAKQ